MLVFDFGCGMKNPHFFRCFVGIIWTFLEGLRWWDVGA